MASWLQLRGAAITAALVLIASTLWVASEAMAQAVSYDLLLRNARVIDGSGSPPVRADVAISGETIAEIAPVIYGPANRVIDVQGRVLAPGFIDIHNHGDAGIFLKPTADNFIRQGVTTIITGPDGTSAVPLGPFLERLAELPKSINIGSFIGQGSVRAAVIGRGKGTPISEELDKMRAIVEQAMKDGALGLSSGLIYVPGVFTPTPEIIELAKIAGRYGGHYQSHIRSESGRVVEAVAEAIEIGEKAGLPTQITHHKIFGTRNWGKSVETLRLVDQARLRGQDVTIDQYPYTAAGGDLSASLLPAAAREGGRDAVLRRLQNSDERAKIKAVIMKTIISGYIRGTRSDMSQVVLSSCRWDKSLEGKSLGDVAQQRGQGGFLENVAEAALWIVEKGGCGIVTLDAMSEPDIERILRHSATMIASDGLIDVNINEEQGGSQHPRDYGTFARVLAVYVRERRVLTLQAAIRKMTSMPAKRLGLSNRGLVKRGMLADLVVMDPATVRDAATYEHPNQFAKGFSMVLVNGQVVFENGAMTPARPGRVIYGPGRP